MRKKFIRPLDLPIRRKKYLKTIRNQKGMLEATDEIIKGAQDWIAGDNLSYEVGSKSLSDLMRVYTVSKFFLEKGMIKTKYHREDMKRKISELGTLIQDYGEFLYGNEDDYLVAYA